jgi:hypothetical protein
MQHLQTHIAEFLLPMNGKMLEDFETLMDSLIFFIMANASSDSNDEGNKLKSEDLLQLSNHAFDLITFLVGLSPLNPELRHYENNPNSPPAT